MVLKRIGVLSAANITALIYGFFGLIVGGIFSLFSLIGSAIGASAGESEAAMAFFFGIGAVLIMPLMYGFFGFLGGLITAVIYNLVAKVTGGLVLELEPKAGAAGGFSSGPTQTPATY